MPLVCSDEKMSVDSKAMMPTQAAAGHQARRRLGRDTAISVVKFLTAKFSVVRFFANETRPLLSSVVRSFARDHDIVHMAFAESGGTDAYEARLLLHIGDGLTAAISHA